MILTNNNILVTKYASKWILNLVNENTRMNEDFVQCMFYLIGDYKELLGHVANHIILSPLNKVYGNSPGDDWDSLPLKSFVSAQEDVLNLLEKYPLCNDIFRYECEEALRENTKIYTGPFKSYELYSRIYVDRDLSDIDRELWLLFYTLQNHPKIRRFIAKNSKIYEDQIYIGKLLNIDKDTLINSLCKFLVAELYNYKEGKLVISELFS